MCVRQGCVQVYCVNTPTPPPPPHSQLFRKPHPQRAPPPAPSSLPLFNAPDAFKRMTVTLPTHQRANVPLVALCFAGNQLVGVTADHQVGYMPFLGVLLRFFFEVVVFVAVVTRVLGVVDVLGGCCDDSCITTCATSVCT